jgi:hypothetical protein
MTVQGDARRRLEQLTVERRKNTNDIVRASRRADDAGVLVNRFEELTDDKWDRLDTPDFLLRTNKLAL